MKEKNKLTEKVKRNDLSASEMKILKDFKLDFGNETSALLADALVEVVVEKSSDQVSHCCDTVYLTGWNAYLEVSHCYDLDKQDVCPYLVMFFFQLVQRTDGHSR